MAKKQIETVEELINIPAERLVHDADELFVSPNDFNTKQLDAIRYAARFMRYRGLGDDADDLLRECDIETVPTFDLNDSEFIKRLVENDISPHVQGFMKMGTGSEAIRYPIVLLSGDIMRWEIFFQKLKHDLKEEAKAELQNDSN